MPKRNLIQRALLGMLHYVVAEGNAWWYEKGQVDGFKAGYEEGFKAGRLFPYIEWRPTPDPHVCTGCACGPTCKCVEIFPPTSPLDTEPTTATEALQQEEDRRAAGRTAEGPGAPPQVS